jgi:flagellin
VTAASGANTVSVLLGNSTTTTSSGLAAIGGVSVATRAAALAAQAQVDGFLQTVNIVSGQIGSALSRFEVASRVLGTSSENFRAAESRITDVDVAEESAALTRENILQKAGAAVLAQANQQPAVALTLLGSLGAR